jgi:four helix bundle protein
MPKGYAHMADQLRRSSLSIPLNIAEGSGKPSQADSLRYYATARGSAMESAAVIHCCAILKIVDPELLSKARALLFRVVQMLSKTVLP